MKRIFFFLVLILVTSKITAQTSIEKKVILLEYQVEELKKENKKLLERIIALELLVSNTTNSSTLNKSKELKSNINPDKKPTKEFNPRCTAITQAGTQCKRNARSNGKCWQHGG